MEGERTIQEPESTVRYLTRHENRGMFSFSIAKEVTQKAFELPQPLS